jgi:ABC-type transporter Mla MlaB component
MEVTFEQGILKLEGSLDESISTELFQKVIEELKTQASGEAIPLDFSKVLRANSAGILTFLRVLKGANLRFKYINTPVWLVEQFSMINQFLENSSYVESLQVPYFCEDDDSEELLTFELGKEIPLLESYSDFELESRMINNKEYEPDVSPERYFAFIAQQLPAFKQGLKDRK